MTFVMRSVALMQNNRVSSPFIVTSITTDNQLFTHRTNYAYLNKYGQKPTIEVHKKAVLYGQLMKRGRFRQNT